MTAYVSGKRVLGAKAKKMKTNQIKRLRLARFSLIYPLLNEWSCFFIGCKMQVACDSPGKDPDLRQKRKFALDPRLARKCGFFEKEWLLVGGSALKMVQGAVEVQGRNSLTDRRT